ncbi:hypothetical protein [Devosia sp. YR412]|uniref:hypothetical protein n=1 Tax=Devosia sp. YR412 TaxID=1881030 RepID=UPI000B89F9DD|nr:hypothetical protein [Devosia sp. YR412]
MWHDLKMIPLEAAGWSPAQLHLLLGLTIYAISSLMFRRPLVALSITAALQLANEILDSLFDYLSVQRVDFLDSLADGLSTLALPVGFTLAWLTVQRRWY